MLNVNPFLRFMILVKIILDKSRASPVDCCSMRAGQHRLLTVIDYPRIRCHPELLQNAEINPFPQWEYTAGWHWRHCKSAWSAAKLCRVRSAPY